MSFDDKDVVVKFGADSAGLEQGLKNVSQTVTDATGKMSSGFGQMKDAVTGHVQALSGAFDGLSGMLSGLTSAFAGVAVVLAGGAMFKEAIGSAIEEGDAVKKLMNSLGMTAEAASKMRISLELVGMSAQDYVGIAMKFDRQLRTNEGSLIALGVVTRDHNGSLLSQEELLKNAADTMMTYKAGTDRNAFAMTAFGRSAEEAFKLLKLDDSIKKRADELAKTYGEIVTDQDLKDIKGYKVEMAAVGVVTGSFAENLGQSVIPALTTAAKSFLNLAEVVMPKVKKGIDDLSVVFTDASKTIQDNSGVICVAVNAVEVAVGLAFGAFAISKITAFTTAAISLVAGWGSALVEAQTSLLALDAVIGGSSLLSAAGAAAGAAACAVWGTAILGVGTAAYMASENLGIYLSKLSGMDKIKPLGGGRSQAQADADYKRTGSTSAPLDPEQTQMNRAAGYDPGQPMRVDTKPTKPQEFINPKAAEEAAKKAAEAAKVAREKAERLAYETSKNEIEGERNASKSKLSIDEELLKQRLALGEIGKVEFLNQEQELEEKKFQIDKKAIEALEALDKGKTDKLKKDQANMLVLENQHAAKIIDINTKTILEQRKQWTDLFKSISDGMGKAIGGFIVGTQSLQSALQGIYSSIQQAFANMLGKMVSDWATEHLTMLFIKESTDTSMAGADAITAQAAVINSKVQASMQIPALASIAAGGAAASVAPTPFVGPALAAAAWSETMAMVMSGLAISSASGGYDIPAGVNPLTQLHSKEMVLPAQYADVIRGVAGGNGRNGGGRAGDEIHIHIDAIDAHSFAKKIDQIGPQLVDSMKKQYRNFKR